MKKSFSLILAIIMIIMMFPVQALAANTHNISYTLYWDYMGEVHGNTTGDSGNTATFTVIPKHGCYVEDIEIREGTTMGPKITWENTDNPNEYKFTMTDTDVFVIIEFNYYFTVDHYDGTTEYAESLQEAFNKARKESYIRANERGTAVANEEKEFWLIQCSEEEIAKITAAPGYKIEILENYGHDGVKYRVTRDNDTIEVIINGPDEEPEENPVTGAPVFPIVSAAVITVLAVIRKKH